MFFDLVLSIGYQEKAIRFALSRNGVSENLGNGVMSLYEGCKTAVSVERELSDSFSVKIGFHQVSAVSPFLLASVTGVLAKDVRDGSLMALLYADGYCKD